MRRLGVLTAVALLAGCAHHRLTPHVGLSALNASPKTVDSLWNLGIEYYNRHRWEKAAVAFDRVELELPPGDPRVMRGRLYLGELYVRSGSNLQGVREYRRLVDEFPTDTLAPVALLMAADAYAKLWRGPELDPTYGYTAQSVYTEVVTRYPASASAAKARTQLQELDNRFALKAYKTANYYLRYKSYEAAILYYKDLVLAYPHAVVTPNALADLVMAYRKLNYAEDMRLICTYMKQNFPDTPQYKKSCSDVQPAPAEKVPGS